MADLLAKQALKSVVVGPQPIHPIPVSVINRQLGSLTCRKWTEYWLNRRDCRQTKLWFPEPNKKLANQLLELPRQDFGMVTRWVTGHCYLARHQSLLYNNSPTCNLCQTGEETPWHILRECPVVRGWEDLPLDNWDMFNLRDTIFPFRYLEVQDYQ